MYAGKDNKKISKDEIIYMGVNTYWEEIDVLLPKLSGDYVWKVIIDTYEDKGYVEKSNTYLTENLCAIRERSVMVMKAVKKSEV